MQEMTFKLANGETMKVPSDEARELVRRLWQMVTEPGAAPLAVAMNRALGLPPVMLRTIELSAREQKAFERVIRDRSLSSVASSRD